MTIKVDIVSAEKELWVGDAAMIYASCEMGEVGIAPRHAPFLARLKPGDVRVELPDGGGMIYTYVSGGIIEVQPHLVTILSDTGDRVENLDESKILEAQNKAKEALKNAKGEFDLAAIQARLAETAAQLAAIQKFKSRKK